MHRNKNSATVARATVDVFGAAFMLAMRRNAWSATYRLLLGASKTAVTVFFGSAFALLMISCLRISCRQAERNSELCA